MIKTTSDGYRVIWLIPLEMLASGAMIYISIKFGLLTAIAITLPALLLTILAIKKSKPASLAK